MSLSRFRFQVKLAARPGWKHLGGGLYSEVYAKVGSDRVVKVCGDSTWEPYIRWATENGFSGNFAPRVYSMHHYPHGEGGVIHYLTASMERLDTTINKADILGGPHAAVYHHIYQMHHNDLENHRVPDTLERMFPGLTCFVKQARKQGYASDWHGSNWMLKLDETGFPVRIVLIDPQSANKVDPLKRWHAVANTIVAA